MRFDHPNHQKYLWDLVNSSQVTGANVEFVAGVKAAISSAEIGPEPAPVSAKRRGRTDKAAPSDTASAPA
jgi:hypothetical protein